MIRVDTWSAVRRAQIWLLASILLISVLPVAHAQSPTGTLIISVHDSSGAVVPDVQLVLSGSGLERTLVTGGTGTSTFESVPPGRYTITATRSGFVPGTLRDVVVTAGSPQGLVVTLRVPGIAESVEVQARSYAVPNATTATKTDTPIMETPMTVQVIPQQVLRDLGIASSGLAEALVYQGVQSLGFEPEMERLVFRGFDSSTTLWNGFRIEEPTSTGEGNGGVWMDNVDRLEVMKGPSSILYGRSEPGGAVNVLTRKPVDAFHGAVRTGIGSWSNLFLAADVSGSLNTSKTLLYRLSGGAEGSNSYYTYGPAYRSWGIAPALAWRLTPATTVSFEGQYRKMEGGNGLTYFPLDPATGRLLDVDRKITAARDMAMRFNQSRSMVGVEHRFNATWALSWKALYDRPDQPLVAYIYHRNPQFPIAGSGSLTIDRWAFISDASSKTKATVLDVTGRFRALGANHTVLVGADYYDYLYRANVGFDFTNNPALQTDYFNPASLPISPDDFPRPYPNETRRKSYAPYVQDQMALPGRVHLLIGARLQHLTQTSPGTPDYDKDFVQPRAGILWRPRPWLSTYYSYAENSGNATGLAFPNQALPPESSRQHEGGVKTESLDGRLTATLSVFNLTKFNITAADPDHPTFSLSIGEVRSRGFEFGVQGALTDSWNVLFNYNNADPKVVVGASGFYVAGQSLPYLSNRNAAVLTSYKLPWAHLRGVVVGGGLNWASDSNPYPGTTLSPAPYTGYAIASALASYATRMGGHEAKLQLNVTNLFNEKYLTTFYDAGTIASGTWSPRQIRVSLNVGF